MAQSVYSQAYSFATFAGYSSIGTTDAAGTAAQFYNPYGVVANSAGYVYVADTFNHTIRQISPAGVVTTIAGFGGDSGSADGTNAGARFNLPGAIASATNGDLYAWDSGNGTIRKLSASGTNWVVTTIAGSAGNFGSSDGTNGAAQFGELYIYSDSKGGLTVDQTGNIYFADYANDTIRKIAPTGTNWVVTTIAGSLTNYGSANGTGTNAQFYYPSGVAVDSLGNLYVADEYNCTIREIRLVGTNWVVSTIAGYPAECRLHWLAPEQTHGWDIPLASPWTTAAISTLRITSKVKFD